MEIPCCTGKMKLPAFRSKPLASQVREITPGCVDWAPVATTISCVAESTLTVNNIVRVASEATIVAAVAPPFSVQSVTVRLPEGGCVINRPKDEDGVGERK